MQAAGVSPRPTRSLALALLLGSAAVVGLVCLASGWTPSAVAGAALLQPQGGRNVDRRSAIAAGLGVLSAVGPLPAQAKKKVEDLSPYSKVDPKAFGGGRVNLKDFKAPKEGEGLRWTGPKFSPNYPGNPQEDPKAFWDKYGDRVNSGVRFDPMNSREEALALIKNSNARTFQDLAEGPQSGGGWYDHMDATRKQTERLYAERAQRKAEEAARKQGAVVTPEELPKSAVITPEESPENSVV